MYKAKQKKTILQRILTLCNTEETAPDIVLKAYAKQPATLRSSTCSSRNTVFIHSVYSMPILYICLQVKRFCCSDSVCSTKKDA